MYKKWTIAAVLALSAISGGVVGLATLNYKPAPAPVATPARTPAAVMKPYAVEVELPGGEKATCIFNNAGGLQCAFPSSVQPRQATPADPADIMEPQDVPPASNPAAPPYPPVEGGQQ